jgi:sugar transferase (PEP-CTERM/EpsH1 system associated)
MSTHAHGSSPILIVHVVHHLQIGGLENGVVNLINRLPQERFRHVVVCIEDFTDFSRRIERADVEIIAMHRSRVGVWRLRWQLLQLFRRLRPDIVHTRNLSGLDALLPARLAGARTLHSEHGFDVDNLKGSALRPTLLRRLNALLVSRYVALSNDLHRVMCECWRIAPTRVQQIYNGVDTQKFTPAQSARRDLLPLNLQGEGLFIVGTVGRVQAVKDQATLLRAFAAALLHCPESRSRLRLVLVGDGPLLPDLRQLAGDLGITEQTWFAGARHDVAALLQSFDLFVLPSLNEGISNTLLEAMATGLPLLATAVGGNVELLTEGVVGLTFTPGDHRSLAVMISQYYLKPELRAEQGAAARAHAVQSFSLQAMVANYQAVYEKI